MHYASIEQISKSFGIRNLFSKISFHIEQGDKIALVARNGTGKSTLLKIIAGLDQPDEGSVWVHKDIPVILLQQEHVFDEDRSILSNLLSGENPVFRLVQEYESAVEAGEELRLSDLMEQMEERNAWNLLNEVKEMLGRLQLHEPQASMRLLSGGQKKRVALAQALITARLHEGRCLLLLDEPTNHLDVGMIEWLEDYLSAHKITLLLVTHDRYFLDAVCNEIIEFEDGRVYVHKGNYDYYLEQKSLRNEVQQSELLKDKNIYRKELEWMRKQPKARTTKSKARQDAFESIREKVSRVSENSELSLQVNMTRLGGKVLEMKKVNMSYGGKQLIRGFDYTFKKGERIGIVGKNGAGKSTFLRIALGELVPDSGKINHGDTVVFGNFCQEGLHYKEDKRAIEFVKEFAEFFPLADGTKISAKQFMEKFGFQAEQQFTPLSKLSGGEKRRLHLLTVLFSNPNFLVLDEPTNDLDLPTLSILESFLLEFPGCILMVSHDRFFMDRLVDHIFAFEGEGQIRDFPGNYSQYREFMEQQKQPAAPTTASSPKTAPVSAAKKGLSFKEKFELQQLNKELALLQEQKEKLTQDMNNGNLPYTELHATAERISAITEELDRKELRWLELSEREEA